MHDWLDTSSPRGSGSLLDQVHLFARFPENSSSLFGVSTHWVDCIFLALGIPFSLFPTFLHHFHASSASLFHGFWVLHFWFSVSLPFPHIIIIIITVLCLVWHPYAEVIVSFLFGFRLCMVGVCSIFLSFFAMPFPCHAPAQSGRQLIAPFAGPRLVWARAVAEPCLPGSHSLSIAPPYQIFLIPIRFLFSQC